MSTTMATTTATTTSSVGVERGGNETRDYGSLRVSMTSKYTWNWSDTESGSKTNVSIWHPVLQYGGDLRPLGSVAFGRYTDPGNTRATLLVGNKPGHSGNPAVKAPTGFTQVWKDSGSGGKHDGAFWHPIAPSGYVAVGDVATYGYDAPHTSMIWCLRADLVSEGEFTWMWSDNGSGASSDVSLWDTKPVSIGRYGSAKVPVVADCFIASNSYNAPSNGLARVPALEVGNDFKPFNPSMPRLDPLNPPNQGEIFNRMEQCRLVLPYVAYFDPTDRASLDKIAKPFCVVTRSCAWRVEELYNNRARDPISREHRLTQGISKTQSESFSHSTGVEVSSSAGIFGVEFGISFNYQFVYQQSNDFTEYEEKERIVSFEISPFTLKARLSRRIFFKATRSDESWVLQEMAFSANDEVHLTEVDLPRSLRED